METLPIEIINQIAFSNLTFNDVANFLKCNRTFYSLLENDDIQKKLSDLWFNSLNNTNFFNVANRLIKYNKLNSSHTLILKNLTRKSLKL